MDLCCATYASFLCHCFKIVSAVRPALRNIMRHIRLILSFKGRPITLLSKQPEVSDDTKASLRVYSLGCGGDVLQVLLVQEKVSWV